VRDGRIPVPPARFNESYMMHDSTSPLHAIIASNEVSVAMMSGFGGRTLTDESILEAVAFRKAIRGLRRSVLQRGDGSARCWPAPSCLRPATPPSKPRAAR
jgi:arginine/lysine/ornithine decarboxylase